MDQIGDGFTFLLNKNPSPITDYSRRFKSRAYDAYPRGRVVYFPKRKKFCLYHDVCLRPEREIREVVEGFDLVGVKMELMKDAHYKCERCSRYYLE